MNDPAGVDVSGEGELNCFRSGTGKTGTRE